MIDRQRPHTSDATKRLQPMQADYSYNQWRRDQVQRLDREYAEQVEQEAGTGALLQS
jgi:hypothetical protein